MSSNQSGAGRREVAYRVFAAEYEDADFEHSESDADERAPNYVVTPTGARANRLFVVGVLTEVDRVNEEMLRGRVVDPTGAFVVYAGQYQPDQLTVLERLDPPAFVAVTGKARTFQPEDSETVYTSIRPESITEVDAESRDRWTVQTAGYTLDRIRTVASALDRDETGDELVAALKSEGVEAGMAEGIPLAIDHYGTTPAYLEDLRRVATEAAEVVAGQREEVSPLERSPADRGDRSLADLVAALPDEPAGAAGAAADAGAQPSTAAEKTAEEPLESGETDTAASDEEASAADAATAAADPEDPDRAGGTVETADAVDQPAADTDELYEFDEEERAELEAEFDTDFTTGSEIEQPTDETNGADEVDAGGREGETATETEATEPDAEKGDGEETAAAVDLEAAVVEAMGDLDDGDGASRSDVVKRVRDEHGASEAAIKDAIEEALMSGKCYEPGEDRLKSI